MGWIVLAAVLAGCGDSPQTTPASPASVTKAEPAGLPALPPYEETQTRGEMEPLGSASAVTFFCRYTQETLVLESLESSGATARDRYIGVLNTRAEDEQVEGWDAFRTSYLELEESDRELWLARNLFKHKLQPSCKHLLSGRPLSAFIDAE